MKSKLSTLVVVSGLLVGLGVMPLAAQTILQLKANIPFEFMVGSRTLPAGEYTVTSQIAPGVVGIRSEDGREGAVALASPVETSGYSDQARLIFHRYGNQYFLSQIWTVGNSAGRELPKSKVERESSQTASLQRENVTILAMR